VAINTASMHQVLLKLNQHTAARFIETSDAIAPLLASEASMSEAQTVRDEWCDLIYRISQSGWHSWEVLNYYLDASPVLLRLGGAASLIAQGEFGCTLLGSSTEPATRYFAGIALISDESAFDMLPHLEATGDQLGTKFPAATSLIASYYQTSFDLLAQNGVTNFVDWLEITGLWLDSARANLTGLYRVTSTLNSAPRWDSIVELARVSVTATLAYLESHNNFISLKVSQQHQLDIQDLMGSFVSRDQATDEWLQKLILVLPRCDEAQVASLLWMGHKVREADLSVALFECMESLPLKNRSVLAPWLDEGLKLFKRNPVAGRAYLALESATANELLEKLTGTLLLADSLRVFQLYVESFLGHRLVLVPQEAGIDFPHTDGVILKLPTSLSVFSSQAENFQTYKLMLLHQLGYFEFGIFSQGNSSDTELSQSSSSRSYRYNQIRKEFTNYKNSWLAEHIFLLLEHGRVDWQLHFRYPGIRKMQSQLKKRALAQRSDVIHSEAVGRIRSPQHDGVADLLELLVRLSLLDPAAGEPAFLQASTNDDASSIFEAILPLLSPETNDIGTTLQCVESVYRLFSQLHPDCDRRGFRTTLPQLVSYRGQIEPEQIMINLQLAELEDEDLELLSDELEDSEDGLSIISMLADDDLDVDKLKQGELDQPGTLLTDLDEREIELNEDNKSKKDKIAEGLKAAMQGRIRPPHQYEFQYDEWDFVIGDYRRNWCTLHEYRVMDEDPGYVDEALSEQSATAASVRRQLNKLRPEMLKKVKGVDDGEELDIERTIEHLVDKRAGVVTEDRIYIEKQRKQRDVAALFLLDMSASTDDALMPQLAGLAAPEEASPGFSDNDFLHDGYMGDSPYINESTRRKIIDVEKEAAILMAEALKNLGDQYAICGFSGYGRDNVEFYVCKDFEENYGFQAKGRLGGIKACRSTRMGPAIRHATKMLLETGCKTKALIIISDGYPQDYDYGKDRSSRDYGIKDTTRALVEARQRDVQGFCLTVDQSGHDYLREMCPDKQYMVIQDVAQLPGELSKIYQMMTG